MGLDLIIDKLILDNRLCRGRDRIADRVIAVLASHPALRFREKSLLDHQQVALASLHVNVPVHAGTEAVATAIGEAIVQGLIEEGVIPDHKKNGFIHG